MSSNLLKIPSIHLVHAVPGAFIPQIGFGTYLIKVMLYCSHMNGLTA